METGDRGFGGYFAFGFIFIGFTPSWNRLALALELLWDLQAAEATMMDVGRIQRMTNSQTPRARLKIDRLAHEGP